MALAVTAVTLDGECRGFLGKGDLEFGTEYEPYGLDAPEWMMRVEEASLRFVLDPDPLTAYEDLYYRCVAESPALLTVHGFVAQAPFQVCSLELNKCQYGRDGRRLILTRRVLHPSPGDLLFYMILGGTTS
jgi:hypothetical protein